VSPAERIAADVAAGHGLTLADLKSSSRRLPVAAARQEAMATLRTITREDGRTPRYSLPWIGRLFDRHHTTVLYACRAVERRQGA
jgi:chromosomal replication initiation ATPase DnaA